MTPKISRRGFLGGTAVVGAGALGAAVLGTAFQPQDAAAVRAAARSEPRRGLSANTAKPTPSPSASEAEPSPSASSKEPAGPSEATEPAGPAEQTEPTRQPPTPSAGGGKGVSVTPFGGATAAITGVGASWYYTWASTTGGTARPGGSEFVPMIWGADAVNDTDLGNATREGSQLLGFNEPDFAAQANMSPTQALDLWPRLEATGLRLGAPAVAHSGDRAGGWLDQFMSGAAGRGLRVDFIPLHWYGGDFSAAAVGHLRNYLEAVHARWPGKPLWLTEYALIDFSSGAPRFPSEAEQIAFVGGVVPMLRSLPYVERHAWFTLSRDAHETGLASPSGVNATGRAYRDA
ncbi:hypothetical protein GCM10028784_35190 [Myceligenerans cantabricum]